MRNDLQRPHSAAMTVMEVQGAGTAAGRRRSATAIGMWHPPHVWQRA